MTTKDLGEIICRNYYEYINLTEKDSFYLMKK